jgi:hypothetical protein
MMITLFRLVGHGISGCWRREKRFDADDDDHKKEGLISLVRGVGRGPFPNSAKVNMSTYIIFGVGKRGREFRKFGRKYILLHETQGPACTKLIY